MNTGSTFISCIAGFIYHILFNKALKPRMFKKFAQNHKTVKFQSQDLNPVPQDPNCVLFVVYLTVI